MENYFPLRFTSFGTLNFKPGLNIVLGKKVSTDDTDTYNSVGKSLALELIHFMLGHNFNKCVTKNLSDYEFVLNFRHLEKQKIKEKKSRLTSIKTELKSFRAIDQSEVLDIEDEIKEIEKVLDNFKIAENYSELVKKADQLTGKIDALSNKIFINNKRIENKQKSLKETPDIPVSVIKKLREETHYFFNEKVENELDKVEEFHITLIKNRRSRFLREIQELEIENKKLSTERRLLDNERAEIMKITKNSGAWDEYESLRNRLESLRRKKDELLKYEDLYKELQKKEAAVKAKFAENNNYAVNYLASKEQDIKRIKEIFREIARNFYHKHPGNIDIYINQNLNAHKIYDINPHIDSMKTAVMESMK